MRVSTRAASVADCDAIERIERSCPEASQWRPEDYLAFDCTVAEFDGQVVGFLAARAIDETEIEVLNVAVAPEFRRRGVAAALFRELLSRRRGEVYLEVRESNQGARSFYQRLGFVPAGRRPGYYQYPEEDAVVMRMHSC